MAESSPILTDELKAFLSGVKVAETITEELRSAISVPTGLEEALKSAVEVNRDVVVAGSAGGGKTHLLHALDEGPRLVVTWPGAGPSPAEPFVHVIPDATVLFDEILGADFSSTAEGRAPWVIAINEGPLLALARRQPDSLFSRAVPLLHAAQRGVLHEHDPEAPVVIDVGGYDPIQNGVVGRLLDLSILRQLVLESPCSCDDASVCPRKLAWRQLEVDEVRGRVNDVLRLATRILR